MTAPAVYYPTLGFVKAELIVNCIIVFLVVVVVSLRVVGRLIGPGLGWDDGFILAATPLGIAMLVSQGLFAPIGNGYSLTAYPELASNVPYILELTFGMQPIYVTLLALVKASMLCFFLRVFVTPAVQLSAKILLGSVAAWWIAYLFACIFLCTPVEAQWTGVGECGHYIPLIQSLIATNAIGDIIIMLLPMQSIWTLEMRSADKVGVTSCFLLGTACVICAIFRLIYISTVDLNSNVTGTMPTTIFLFILEPNLAILCVSIPMLRPFYARYKKRTGGSRLQEYSDERSTGYNKSKNQHTKPGEPSRAGGNGSTWEMDDYYPGTSRNKPDVMATAYGDESESEKNLTAESASIPNHVIRVETRWDFTR
ncbi:hypothetical protein F4778DRAFT_718845, partial [Xylariomycetidae sp. FL2044]